MMANCSDNVYVIQYTDESKGTITIAKSALVTALLDIALVGKSRLNYGEIFNENMLHLLENFACPEDAGSPGNPDLTIAFGELLANPIEGQRWYNSTRKRTYTYSLTDGWVPMAREADVAGNSGIAAHGTFIPRPVGSDGYVFPYSECSFTVSAHSNASVTVDGSEPSDEIDYMRCYASTDGQITMQFRFRGESSLRDGYANYQIIGVRGSIFDTVIETTPYPVPEPTPGISPTLPPTPTPTPTVTRSPTPTPTATPSITVSPTPGATPTPTPTVTVTSTPSVTTTPAAPTPTPTVTVTSTPSMTTPTPTPTVTPTPSPAFLVALSDQGTSSFHDAGSSADSSVGYALYSNGQAWLQSSSAGGFAVSGEWLVSGAASNFEAFVTYTNTGVNDPTGYGLGGSAFGTWLSLSTSRNWTLTTTPAYPGGDLSEIGPTYTGQFNVQIRRVSDGTVLDTCVIDLSAQLGAPL